MASTPAQVDDFLLEQPFPLSWLEMVGVNRTSWDFNAGSSGITIRSEAADGTSAPHRSVTMSLNASGTPSISTSLSTGLRYEASELQESIHQFQPQSVVHFPFEDTPLPNGVQKQYVQEDFDAATGVSAGPPSVRESLFSKGIHESFRSSSSQGITAERRLGLLFNPSNPSIADSTASRLSAPVTCRAPGLPRSPSVSSSGSDGLGFQQSPPCSQFTSQVAAAWQQSYLRGALQPCLDVSQANGESFFIYESMQDDPISQVNIFNDATALSLAGLPDSSLEGAQVGLSQKADFEPGQQSQQQVKEFQQQGGHGSIIPLYETQMDVAQPQGTATAMLSGTARPRQRARRGQATDPHSIAERLRRERIAERMKALQELVPNSNKTDKASMLDEIVDYVKFLQLQVKVLSMSRLGGAGTVAPLIADLPVEGQNSLMATALGWSAGSSNPSPDAMTLIERQVARLMEEDMGSAMRFLQGRGLCLMPVSLATTISATNSRSTGGVRDLTVLDRSQIDASSSTTVGAGRTSSTLPSIGIISSNSDCFDGGSEPILEGVQTKEHKDKLESSVAERTYSGGMGLPLCAAVADIADAPKQGR